MPPSEGRPDRRSGPRLSYDRAPAGVHPRDRGRGADRIVFGGAPFAVMMATPPDLEDFAVGFALTEGIVEASPTSAASRSKPSRRLARRCHARRRAIEAHLARGRAISGRTGCGLCGIEDFAHLPPPRPPPSAADRARGDPRRARRARARQPLNASPAPCTQPHGAGGTADPLRARTSGGTTRSTS